MEHAADIGNARGVLGQALVPAALAASPLAIEGAVKAAAPFADLAKEDPAAAAARAMADPKYDALKGQAEVRAARPYLAGATDLADLQSRIAPAKAEVWQPYSDALNQVGGNIVNGPDGPMPVAYYEAERLKNTAMLDQKAARRCWSRRSAMASARSPTST
jgi:hypothetical protein